MNSPVGITVMTSREFNQDRARAKRAARQGPVFITDRGQPSFVLITKAEFDRMKALEEKRKTAGKPKSLREALMDPRPEADFEWDPPRMSGFSLKIPDFE